MHDQRTPEVKPVLRETYPGMYDAGRHDARDGAEPGLDEAQRRYEDRVVEGADDTAAYWLGYADELTGQGR